MACGMRPLQLAGTACSKQQLAVGLVLPARLWRCDRTCGSRTSGCGAQTACGQANDAYMLHWHSVFSWEGPGFVLYLQARHPCHPVQQPCAGKIGDDADFAKVQVDKRLPEAQQERVRNHFKAMFGVRKVDGDKSSKLLAAAYHDVCARHKFC